MLRSRQFVAIPSLGGLSLGHVLIVPKDHYWRMADLPPGLEQEYAAFQSQVIRRLEQTFGAPVHRFEHGSDASGLSTPCTIAHAHLHLLPAAVEVSQPLTQKYTWRSIDPQQLRAESKSGQYLFYRSPSGQAQIANGSTFTSQYLRKVFAEALRVREWNWRIDPRTETVEETYRRLDAVKIQA